MLVRIDNCVELNEIDVTQSEYGECFDLRAALLSAVGIQHE
jgi:hypothetical protein